MPFKVLQKETVVNTNYTVVPAIAEGNYRFERKYGITRSQSTIIAQKLKHIMPYDPCADERGYYLVRSVYFDSPYDTAVYEKLDGASTRAKCRVRLYNGDTSKIKLEKKQRIHNMMKKQSCDITAVQYERIVGGDWDWMLQTGQPLLVETYSKLRCGLRPKCVVEYDRQVFLCHAGNVRITIDKNVRCSNCIKDFLEKDTCCISVPTEDFAVLEVKYDTFLPRHIQLTIEMDGLTQEAVSKYVLSRAYDLL